ncbi:MAG: hypothetical protein RIR00_349, partial [Pseudomonadota bacterium]
MSFSVQSLTRFFLALLFATAISALHFGLWAWVNQGSTYTEAENNIRGYAYSPYQREQSPLEKKFPSAAEIAADLDLLALSSGRIRLYGSLENAWVIPLANKYPLRVTAGAWLSGDAEANQREVQTVIETARNHRHVERVIVGNESLLRADLNVDTIIPYLRTAREALKKPVSTAEPWHVWLRYPQLVDNVDFITVHLLPYHEGVPVEQAVSYALMRYDELVKLYPRKKIVIGEVGWPSKGPILGGAVPSVENEARFIREFLAQMRLRHLDYYIMEAIDQPWKIEVEGWAGAYWGMYDAERQLKFPLEGEVIGDTNWDEKARIATALAFIPMLLVFLFLQSWSLPGRIWLSAL